MSSLPKTSQSISSQSYRGNNCEEPGCTLPEAGEDRSCRSLGGMCFKNKKGILLILMTMMVFIGVNSNAMLMVFTIQTDPSRHSKGADMREITKLTRGKTSDSNLDISIDKSADESADYTGSDVSVVVSYEKIH